MPQSAATGALAVEGLCKAFAWVTVLDGVGLAVPAGRVVALLGPSGCGKTTLLRCIAGLERPDAGQVRLDGRDLSAPGAFVAPERRRIGMVFQDGALFPHLTVAGNVGYGLSREERRGPRVDEALALVDLAGFGVTAVFVTHDQEEAFVVGDEVAVMLAGRVVQQATPAELCRAPASRAVAGFLGDANLLPGVATAGLADTAIGRVPLRAELRGNVDVLLRPEQLRVSAGAAATIDAVQYFGHDAVYLTRLAGGPAVRVRVLDVPEFRPGDTVDLHYVGGA